MLRVMLWCLLSLALCSGNASAQGPASKLMLANATKERVVFTTYRPSAILVTVPFEPNDRQTIELAPTKDDRVLVASKAEIRPYEVLATTHFNASKATYPTIGAALVDYQGGYRIVFYYMEEGTPKSLLDDEQSKRLIQENREAIKKANAKEKKVSEGP